MASCFSIELTSGDKEEVKIVPYVIIAGISYVIKYLDYNRDSDTHDMTVHDSVPL